MKKQYSFEQYTSRMKREGQIKALLCGLTVGFAVDLLVAFVAWFVAWNGLWAAIVAGVLTFAISTPIFYGKLFRPTPKQIAARLDALGLEERVITMVELEQDSSYLATCQRKDAQEHLKTMDPARIKYRVLKMAAVLSIVAVLGVFMTAITAMSEDGTVPSGDDFISDILKPDPEIYVAVSYIVEEGGSIDGEAEQLVLSGNSATPVIAVADDGWMFDGWDDGSEDPARTDTNVREELILTAMFVRVEEQGEGEGDGEGEGENSDPNEPSDQPSESDSSEESGSGSSNSSQIQYEENNQIIDGETYYRSVYEGYYEQAMKILSEGGDIPAEMRAIIELYFGVIL